MCHIMDRQLQGKQLTPAPAEVVTVPTATEIASAALTAPTATTAPPLASPLGALAIIHPEACLHHLLLQHRQDSCQELGQQSSCDQNRS